jgi:two-component sensor histidine kinase
MPPGDKDEKAGLGTGIVQALSKQLDASVTVLDANPGTLVEIRHDPS